MVWKTKKYSGYSFRKCYFLWFDGKVLGNKKNSNIEQVLKCEPSISLVNDFKRYGLGNKSQDQLYENDNITNYWCSFPLHRHFLHKTVTSRHLTDSWRITLRDSYNIFKTYFSKNII